MTGEFFLFGILIVLSGCFSAVEIAYFSLTPGRVRTMVHRKLKGAKTVERLKARPSRLLITVLIGNNLVNIFAAALATKISLALYGSRGVGIATGMVTLLVLIFGEIFPKSLAQMHAGKFARIAAGPLTMLQIFLSPFVFLLEKLTQGLSALTHHGNTALVSEEEIRSMMHIGVEEGAVEGHEQEFVERLFRFNDVAAHAVMTPLVEVVTLDGEKPVNQIMHFAVHSGFSRFPVFEGSESRIIGVVHSRDLMRANNSDERDEPVRSFISVPVFVHSEERLDVVLRRMQRERQHLMFVRDEKGEMRGIITVEDVLEELVGEIYDESDQKETND